MKKHNFSSGPGILPQEVIEQAAAGAANLEGSGLSVLEMSHRSKPVIAIFDEAEALLRELIGIPDTYAVIFISGGASSQFYQVPMNLLPADGAAAYTNTGVWADKAIIEAEAFGEIRVLASSKADNYTHIPKDFEIPADVAYFHYTSNNTIYGTQYHQVPVSPVPLVCDMSSDFLSRPLDVTPFGLIYAGAQKNLGPAGVTILIIRKDLLGKVDRHLPSMLDYRQHIKNASMFNTPPVFPVYVCLLTLRWLKKLGGLVAIEAHNKTKAALLYNYIDQSAMFRGTTAVEDRSLMNATFVMNDPELEASFLALAASRGIIDIKGHRSVGGFRASIYNAMPLESVAFLVETMRIFEAEHTV